MLIFEKYCATEEQKKGKGLTYNEVMENNVELGLNGGGSMKRRVMLVDDEPLILQGLSVLVDWNQEGFEIVKLAKNGLEAVEYLKEHTVDLIIADIKMPVMTGLELLQYIRTQELSDAYFVILSGYGDFSYAQQAIRYSCTEYMLKPIQKGRLLEILRQIRAEKEQFEKQNQVDYDMQQAFMVQNLVTLLRGKFTEHNLDYIKTHLKVTGPIRYVHISLERISELEEMTDMEVAQLRKTMYENCIRFLGPYKNHCFCDVLGYEEEYEIGFLYCDYMVRQEFLERLLDAAQEGLVMPVVALVGKRVDSIEKISRSYSTACVLRSFRGLGTHKKIYYYEEEVQVQQNRIILCSQSLDQLILAIEHNNPVEICSGVDALCADMERMGMSKEVVSMNTNYLLFQLIHLAVEQDESISQEEVMVYISENIFDTDLARGSRTHLRRFACEYAEYLVQLRKNVSRGVLQDIEKEIRENYAQNLTLRELGKKYYINSSYLGQVFRKKYGQSFKDYLCSYRINEAAQMLLRTDRKISVIAESVGYKDTDYFISKFIELKGCTPTKFRKNIG